MDAITVVQGNPYAGGYFAAVDNGAVLRARIEDHPAAVRLSDQYRMQP
jgi:hypothetical protein